MRYKRCLSLLTQVEVEQACIAENLQLPENLRRIGPGERQLLEKVSFQKGPFSRDPRDLGDS